VTEPSDADARTAPGARRALRRLIGGSLLVLAAVVAVLVVTGRGDGGERPVGRLIASDLGDAGTEHDGPSTTAAAAPLATAPAGPTWTVAAIGRPTALGPDGTPPPTSPVDLEDGAYLWNDFNGWHLWLVGDATGPVTVTTDDRFAKVDPVGGAPAVDAGDERFVLSRGSTDAPVVGVDFNPGFFAEELTIAADDSTALHLGGLVALTPSPAVVRYGPAG